MEKIPEQLSPEASNLLRILAERRRDMQGNVDVYCGPIKKQITDVLKSQIYSIEK